MTLENGNNIQISQAKEILDVDKNLKVDVEDLKNIIKSDKKNITELFKSKISLNESSNEDLKIKKELVNGLKLSLNDYIKTGGKLVDPHVRIGVNLVSFLENGEINKRYNDTDYSEYENVFGENHFESEYSKMNPEEKDKHKQLYVNTTQTLDQIAGNKGDKKKEAILTSLKNDELYDDKKGFTLAAQDFFMNNMDISGDLNSTREKIFFANVLYKVDKSIFDSLPVRQTLNLVAYELMNNMNREYIVNQALLMEKLQVFRTRGILDVRISNLVQKQTNKVIAEMKKSNLNNSHRHILGLDKKGINTNSELYSKLNALKGFKTYNKEKII